MILVSFSSAKDVLSHDVKNNEIFSSQDTENPPFHFFGGTPGILLMTHASEKSEREFFSHSYIPNLLFLSLFLLVLQIICRYNNYDIQPWNIGGGGW